MLFACVITILVLQMASVCYIKFGSLTCRNIYRQIYIYMQIGMQKYANKMQCFRSPQFVKVLGFFLGLGLTLTFFPRLVMYDL